jgi:hypothetical protein
MPAYYVLLAEWLLLTRKNRLILSNVRTSPQAFSRMDMAATISVVEAWTLRLLGLSLSLHIFVSQKRNYEFLKEMCKLFGGEFGFPN